MAAQKAHAAALQSLHTRVLKRRSLGVGVGLCCNASGNVCELAEVMRVSHGRFTGSRVADPKPRADLVLAPNIIIGVKEIGWAGQGAEHPDLIHWHTKSIM